MRTCPMYPKCPMCPQKACQIADIPLLFGVRGACRARGALIWKGYV